jgi:hypothetical protein
MDIQQHLGAKDSSWRPSDSVSMSDHLHTIHMMNETPADLHETEAFDLAKHGNEGSHSPTPANEVTNEHRKRTRGEYRQEVLLDIEGMANPYMNEMNGKLIIMEDGSLLLEKEIEKLHSDGDMHYQLIAVTPEAATEIVRYQAQMKGMQPKETEAAIRFVEQTQKQVSKESEGIYKNPDCRPLDGVEGMKLETRYQETDLEHSQESIELTR